MINDSVEFQCLATNRWAEHALHGIPRKQPDLVVVDIILPRRRGTECIWRLKQKLPGLRSFVVTGQPPEKVLFEALAAGAGGFLEKPCLRDELLQAFRDLCAGKSPLAEKARQAIFRHFREHGPKAFLLDTLTERERAVLSWAGQGLRDRAIAERLGVEGIPLQGWIRCWLHRREILRSFLSESERSACARPWSSRQLPMTSTLPACQWTVST